MSKYRVNGRLAVLGSMFPPEEYVLKNLGAIGKILGHQCHRYDDLENTVHVLRLQAADDAPITFDQGMIKAQAKALATAAVELLTTQQSVEPLLGLLLVKGIITVDEAMSGVPQGLTDDEIAMIKANLASAMEMGVKFEKVLTDIRAKQKINLGDKNA